MPFYEWSEALSVGIPLLDADHRALIRLINRLHDDPAIDPGQVFDHLLAYIAFHFAREERILEACGFPGLDLHKNEHDAFRWFVRDLRGRHIRGEGAVAGEMADYLKTWLNNHILIQDMAYRPFVRDSRAAAEAARAVGPCPIK